MSLYLPEDIKHRVAEAARWHGMTEDDYMREAITRVVSEELIGDRPRPTLPLFDSGDPHLAGRADEILEEGFGREERG